MLLTQRLGVHQGAVNQRFYGRGMFCWQPTGRRATRSPRLQRLADDLRFEGYSFLVAKELRDIFASRWYDKALGFARWVGVKKQIALS